MEQLEAPWVGNPPDMEEKIYCCPICGKECDEVFVADFKIIGCNRCVKVYDTVDAEFLFD